MLYLFVGVFKLISLSPGENSNCLPRVKEDDKEKERGQRPCGRESNCKRRRESCGVGEAFPAVWTCMFWHVPSWKRVPWACVFVSVTDQCCSDWTSVFSETSPCCMCVCKCASTHARLANGVFASVGSERDIPNWHRQYCIMWMTEQRDKNGQRQGCLKIFKKRIWCLRRYCKTGGDAERHSDKVEQKKKTDVRKLCGKMMQRLKGRKRDRGRNEIWCEKRWRWWKIGHLWGFLGPRQSIILLISILPPSFYEFNPGSLPSAIETHVLFLHFCLVSLLASVLLCSEFNQ